MMISFMIGTTAVVMAYAIAIPSAIYMSRRKGKWQDKSNQNSKPAIVKPFRSVSLQKERCHSYIQYANKRHDDGFKQ